jgi:DNA-directed RNA polymerase specialized sigma subunit
MSNGEEDLNWEKAESRSDLFSRYWYHPKAGEILENITGSSSITFLNDRKYISIYAMFSAIRKDLSDLVRRVNDLENQSREGDLEDRVKALEEKLPKTRTEKIRYDLVNTDKKQKEIAERYNVSEEYVSKVKREAGIQ